MTTELHESPALPQSVEGACRFEVDPPLNAGDRLSRFEFHRRYEAHPEIRKAELIEGVVYMPSPVRNERHSRPHGDLVTWLGTYRSKTPGVLLNDNGTVLLDLDNEVQPDAFLRLDEAHGGKCCETEEDYLEGPPELIVEVSASSAAYDLHDKKRVYQRNAVPEYVAVQVYERRVDWFALREGVYTPLVANEGGILKSEVFPGLWLQPRYLWTKDLAGMLATLQEGLQSPEHASLVSHLEKAASPS